MDIEKLKREYVGLLSSEDKLKIEIFLEEINTSPLPNWHVPDKTDIDNIMLAREYLPDYDNNPLKAAKNHNHALAKALEAREKVFAERFKRAGLSSDPTIDDFNGNQEALNYFIQDVTHEANIVGEKIFELYTPMTRNPITGKSIFISAPLEL